MVNYCCVTGCDRNSRTHGRLNYFSLPRCKQRLAVWLKAAGRKDLLDKEPEKLQSIRICSWHFSQYLIKNKFLSPEAVPTLNLPDSPILNTPDPSKERKVTFFHADIICDDCGQPISGFRYKCVTCLDFDLCDRCEMQEKHAEHCMLRIPAPLKSSICEDLTRKWQEFFKAQHFVPEFHEEKPNELSFDSSDDEPILSKCNKSRRRDSGIELSEEEKTKIENEVARMLSSKKKTGKSNTKVGKAKKRHSADVVIANTIKQAKVNADEVEVAFAAVDDFKEPHSMKSEVVNIYDDNIEVHDNSIMDVENTNITDMRTPQLKYTLTEYELPGSTISQG